jgi:NH3-dependent NAD+ synthetase
MSDSLTCEWFCPVCKVSGNSSLGSDITQKLIETTVSKSVTALLNQFQEDLKKELVLNLESDVTSKCSLAKVETKIEDIVTRKLSQYHSDRSKKFESDVREINCKERERQKCLLNIVAYRIPESCEEAADIQMFVQDHLAQL